MILSNGIFSKESMAQNMIKDGDFIRIHSNQLVFQMWSDPILATQITFNHHNVEGRRNLVQVLVMLMTLSCCDGFSTIKAKRKSTWKMKSIFFIEYILF